MPLCCPQLHLLKRRRPLPREWRLRSPWRVVRLALHSLLCPGLRCGASLQPEPYGATAARDANASAAVAHFFTSQRQPWAARWSPSSPKVKQQWQRRFEERRLVVVVVKWVVGRGGKGGRERRYQSLGLALGEFSHGFPRQTAALDATDKRG